MRRRIILTIPLAALLLSGCSFRGSATLPGEVKTLSFSGAFGVNQPLKIIADARFVGSVTDPSLSIHQIDTAARTLKVMAFARRSQPHLGLGIFPVDTTTPQTVEITATVAIAEAGTYRVEGLSPDTGLVTATASVEVN